MTEYTLKDAANYLGMTSKELCLTVRGPKYTMKGDGTGRRYTKGSLDTWKAQKTATDDTAGVAMLAALGKEVLRNAKAMIAAPSKHEADRRLGKAQRSLEAMHDMLQKCHTRVP